MIARRVRRGLPLETGFMNFLDLDRCYSKAYIPLSEGDGELVLYNLHLSAYTSDGTIATEQFKLLCADMAEEYASGNYCVAGGDFNKDLPGNAGEIFGVSSEGYTWAQPLDMSLIPEGLNVVPSLDLANPVPSCRNADTAYLPGKIGFQWSVICREPNISLNRSCHTVITPERHKMQYQKKSHKYDADNVTNF